MTRKSIDSYIDERGNKVQRRADGSLSVSLSFENDPGLTEQSHKDSTDLNYIISRYVRMNQPITTLDDGFKDFTLMPDYQTALDTVKNIDNLFSNMSIEVKNEYKQNPALFMKALEDPSQRDKLVAMGVFKASPVIPDIKSEENSSSDELEPKS